MENKEVHKRYENIKDSVKNGVILYGAGINGRWCLDFLNRKEIKVLAFIDSNKELLGKNIEGIEIISYQMYLDNYSNKIILVTSKHHVKEIMNMHKDNKKIMSFDAWFIQTNYELYKRLRFNDEKSYIVLNKIMECMIDSDNSKLYTIAELNQYFAFSPFFNTGNETFVDMGGYVGDTIERFLFAQNGSFDKIYVFEPGKVQINALKCRIQRLVKEWAIDEKDIVIENMAIGEKVEEAFIEENINSLASMHINYSLGNKISVCSLDEYFKDKNVSFIKVDIEGNEYESLKGAENLIKRCRPKMAISVYHKPDDLLRITKLINSWKLDYKFALRHHSSMLMETILYCW